MDLNIINVFKLYSVTYGNGDGIAGEMPVICRFVIDAADAACRKHGIACFDMSDASVLIAHHNADRPFFMLYDIEHLHVFDQFDIVPLHHIFKKL